MRYIKKPHLSQVRSLSNKTIPTTSEKAGIAWSKFKRKRQVSKELLEIQYGLCCYTELNLTDYDKDVGSHIEHEKPKSKYPELTFNFHNLLLSAISSERLGSFSNDTFAGDKKGSDFDEDLFISPQSINFGDYFIYASHSGKISPHGSLEQNDKVKADYMIRLLNLNAGFLVAERQQHLYEIDEFLKDYIDMLPNEERRKKTELLAKYVLLPGNQHNPQLNYNCDHLISFHSAIRKMLGKIGENVIRDYNKHHNSLI